MKPNPYMALNPFQKQEFLCKLIHCIQKNATLYESAEEIILLGYEWGIFKGVKIGLELTTVENEEI